MYAGPSIVWRRVERRWCYRDQKKRRRLRGTVASTAIVQANNGVWIRELMRPIPNLPAKFFLVAQVVGADGRGGGAGASDNCWTAVEDSPRTVPTVSRPTSGRQATGALAVRSAPVEPHARRCLLIRLIHWIAASMQTLVPQALVSRPQPPTVKTPVISFGRMLVVRT